MSNVIKLPTTAEQVWKAIAETTREFVLASGGDSAMCDFVCDRLRADFDYAWGESTVLATVADLPSIQQLRTFHAERFVRLMHRLTLAHVETYQQGRRPK